MSELQAFLDAAPITIARLKKAVFMFGETAVNEFLGRLTAKPTVKFPDWSKMSDDQIHDWLYKHPLSDEDMDRVPQQALEAAMRSTVRYYEKHIKGRPPKTVEEMHDRMRLGEVFPNDVFGH